MQNTLSISLIVISLCAGCATKVWYKPGATSTDAHRDFAGCITSARIVNNPMSAVNAWTALAEDGRQKDLITHCMLGKGYELVPRKTIPDGNKWPAKQ